MEIGFVITSFGKRGDQLQRMIENIRQYSNAMITVWCNMENPVPVYPGVCTHRIQSHGILRKGSSREGIHNSNYYKAEAVFASSADVVCVLDDDMKIVSKDFMQGFELALHFDIAMPVNPRVFVQNNAMGEDADDEDRKFFSGMNVSTACNLSPMFVLRKSTMAITLLSEYMTQLGEKPCRGTLAMSKAMVLTCIAPLFLPEQWCVGRQNAEYLRDYHYMYREKRYDIKPICLHWGQPKVREVFKDYEDNSLQDKTT